MRRKDRPQKPVYLTDRERECLTWAARGKSSWDTGEIPNISQKTVEFHLTNVYRKLETQNRLAAIVKALHMGLINL